MRGCITIEVSKPYDDYMSRDFYCRKVIYALPLQAAVNSKLLFLYMGVIFRGPLMMWLLFRHLTWFAEGVGEL